MTEKEARSIQCPKCKATYRVAATYQGNVKCKKCHSTFLVGLNETQLKGRKGRDEADQRAAKKLMIIGIIALVLLGGLIAFASKSGSKGGTTPDYDPTEAIRKREAEARRREFAERNESIERGIDPNTGQPIVARGEEPWRQGPGVIADRFLEGIARLDREAIGKHFDMNSYLAWAERAHNDAGKFVSTPEQVAHWSEAAWSEILDPERAGWIERVLLPKFQQGDANSYRKIAASIEKATVEYSIKDSAGEPMLDLKVELKPKVPGRYETADDWAVEAAYDRWLQPSLRVDKAEKRVTEIGIGRYYLSQVRANKASAAGPPQADPVHQGPAVGCDMETFRSLEQAVATYMSPTTAARAYAEARDVIVAAGKNAIPPLLNTLVTRDHTNDATQIREANMAILLLREITGESFGYAPGQAKGFGQSIVTATPEERVLAVRRWFGWWNTKGRSFVKKTNEEPDDKD